MQVIKGLLTLLFRCISCHSGFSPSEDLSSFPLCQTCLQRLGDCPVLCKNCGSPHCPSGYPSDCLRPWVHHSAIHSYSARYLLFESGYRVLRKWKTQRGSLWDQQILQAPTSLLSTWQSFSAEAIVPIPQPYSRAWTMRGSRAEILAKWVSYETRLPILPLLKSTEFTSLRKRQAELKLEERLQNPFRFKTVYVPKPPKRVILVDDFMTTGHTIRRAASHLLSLGVDKLHVFCLGVRPTQLHLQSHPHLVKSLRRTIPIG